jgi:hypothetical protein
LVTFFKIWSLLVTFSAYYLNTPLVLLNHLIDKLFGSHQEYTIATNTVAPARGTTIRFTDTGKAGFLLKVCKDLHRRKLSSIFAQTGNLMKDFQLLIYNTPTEDIKVDVILKDEDIWASQKAMASLFGVQVPDISKHINNIFESGELTSSTTVSKMETVVQRGFRGQVPDEARVQLIDIQLAVLCFCQENSTEKAQGNTG